ncbi:MAG: RNase adapter RapZ [Rhodospirillales bacterium]|nr:RNase adapter RapZ [Rhodospirillales bacterium]
MTATLQTEALSVAPRSSAAPPALRRDRLLLVTGMSGAGHSTALKALEDMGYEAVDNLPISLLPNIVRREPALAKPLAIGIDIRTRDFGIASFLDALAPLVGTSAIDLKVVFLDCEDELLLRRYTETRRRHPLAGDRQVSDGIRLEREHVSPLRERADLVIDTSALTAADLRRLLQGHFALDKAPGVSVFVTSFSYRNGLPRDADLVFDVRFLENPHYTAALRHLTGLDAPVGAFIEADPDFAPFFDRLAQLLLPLLPRYDREGKSYLTIAIGCTGGQHRSVFVAERLAACLRAQGKPVDVAHRDLAANLRPGAPLPGDTSPSVSALKDIA